MPVLRRDGSLTQVNRDGYGGRSRQSTHPRPSASAADCERHFDRPSGLFCLYLPPVPSITSGPSQSDAEPTALLHGERYHAGEKGDADIPRGEHRCNQRNEAPPLSLLKSKQPSASCAPVKNSQLERALAALAPFSLLVPHAANYPNQPSR